MSDILIIEDDDDIRLTTIEFLEMEGYRACGCENGRIAIDYLHRNTNKLPQLILADLTMPVMGGQAFREAQIADPVLSEIPCVIMSADGRIDEKCREYGVEISLRKPVDLDALLAVIKKFVKS